MNYTLPLRKKKEIVCFWGYIIGAILMEGRKELPP